MTVHRPLLLAVALLVLAMGAGCRDRNATPTIAETDEAGHQEGLRLRNLGRHAEALEEFRKVIEKRGSRGAAESHLESGVIYLYTLKDPIYASHHFREYLRLQPNSKEADLVRGKLDEAKRDVARTIPGRLLEDQSMRLESAEEIERLRRENAELRAEIATLRGAAPGPVTRNSRTLTIDLPRVLNPPAETSAPPVPGQAQAAEVPIVQPAPRPIQSPVSASPAPAARTHMVEPRESAWSIARKYYGSATTTARVQAILDLNGVAAGELQPGMVLKIP